MSAKSAPLSQMVAVFVKSGTPIRLSLKAESIITGTRPSASFNAPSGVTEPGGRFSMASSSSAATKLSGGCLAAHAEPLSQAFCLSAA